MVKKLNSFLLIVILFIFISFIFIIGWVIKIPDYLFFTGLKNDKTVVFKSSCCNFKIGEIAYISLNNYKYLKTTITRIEKDKIYLDASKKDIIPPAVLIRYKRGSLPLLEIIIKKIFRV